MLDNEIVNFKICGIIKNETVVPSVTELFIAAFVFENEAHELYGVNIEGNVLDFKGNFYKFPDGVEAPMTIISPEQLAAREKAAKIAAAKAAREAKAKASRESDGSNESTPDSKTESKGQNTEDLEAKLAGMDPEKAAKCVQQWKQKQRGKQRVVLLLSRNPRKGNKDGKSSSYTLWPPTSCFTGTCSFRPCRTGRNRC